MAEIPQIFITHAADILGDTNRGLSGSQIARYCADFAVDLNVEIPHSQYPFPMGLSKRIALRENLARFSSEQQYKIIKTLCELELFKDDKDVKDLKIKLITRYGHLATDSQIQEINETLIDETKHWLADYPESLDLYEQALSKFGNDIFQRNLLDDLRLALEKLLKSILDNDKPLEKQAPAIGSFLKDKKVSKEMVNMFVILMDYYCKYQNTYIKHDDAVVENEIEYIFEMTSSFMKFLIRIQ